MTSDPQQQSLDLIQQAQGGNDEALDALIRKHLPGLRAFVRARSDPLLRARESCSDLVQSACREALENLGNYEYRGEGSFRYWLFSLAMNKLKGRKKYYTAQKRDAGRDAAADVDHLQQDRLAELYMTMGSPSQHAMAQEVVEIVEAALDKLPEHFKEVVLLSRIVGLSNEEIGVQLDKNAGAVRVLLHRALARLATAMEQVKTERRVD